MAPHHKLLLPWPHRNAKSSVIDCVLSSWMASRVDAICVVIRADDVALRDALGRKCQGQRVDVAIADPAPPQMKDSILCGLELLRQKYQPRTNDLWLVAPADMPNLKSALIDQVLLAATEQNCLVPRFGDHDRDMRPGHPVAFPWAFASQVAALDADQGLKRLVETNPVQWLDRPAHERPTDIDTPAQYQSQLLGKRSQQKQ
jgi:molybdenum cofactor cytidylyltransferase